MLPHVAEPTLPPTVTALARAVRAMVRRKGTRLEWTPNTLLEQLVHHITNKAQQKRRQMLPSLWGKDGNLQPHSPLMVHFILDDHTANQKGTKVQLTQNLTHTHLQYTVPISNALVTYGTAGQSTYRIRPDAEGTPCTVYTWAQYNDLPVPTWHQNPTWHQLLHGKPVPRQDGPKPTGKTTQGGGTSPTNIVNSALADARMPLIHTRHPTPDNTTHRRTWGTMRRALHHDCKRQGYPTASTRIKNCTIPSLVTQIVIPFVRVMSYLPKNAINNKTHTNMYKYT